MADELETRRIQPCPRCRAAFILEGRGALSRTTRDDGAEILVCPRCGEREALYGNEPAAQVPFTKWPVPIETLLTEERQLLERTRRTLDKRET